MAKKALLEQQKMNQCILYILAKVYFQDTPPAQLPEIRNQPVAINVPLFSVKEEEKLPVLQTALRGNRLRDNAFLAFLSEVHRKCNTTDIYEGWREYEDEFERKTVGSR